MQEPLGSPPNTQLHPSVAATRLGGQKCLLGLGAARGCLPRPQDTHVEATSCKRSGPRPHRVQSKKSVPAGFAHKPLLLCAAQNRGTNSYCLRCRKGPDSRGALALAEIQEL